MSLNIPSYVDPKVAEFLRGFYALSDHPTDHDNYIKNFASSNVHFQVGPMEPLNAHSDIHEWRVKRWEPVNWRRHDVLDAFVNPQDSKQIMIRGTVDYGNKDGTNPASRFGAWLRFVEEGGQLRLQHYEVWSTPVQKKE